MSDGAAIEGAFATQRRRLWGLCYRMSGCPADADDWLQDAFERALSQPPADLERDLGAWLTRVTMNVSRDHLRRRKHRAYAGPWLPGPIETSDLMARMESGPTPESRYSQMESVSLAFLGALEELTPNQRAVLILRDVMDYSVRETAELLELTGGSVKTIHHRARAAAADYEARRVPDTSARRAAAARALQAFLVHVGTNNVDALRELLAEDVVAFNDGAGQYTAAQRPVRGRDKVVLFHRKIMRMVQRVRMCSVNGQAAMLFEAAAAKPGQPERVCVWVELDAHGRIARIVEQVADRKLSRLPWETLPRPRIGLVWTMLQSAMSTPGWRSWLPGSTQRAIRHMRGVARRFV